MCAIGTTYLWSPSSDSVLTGMSFREARIAMIDRGESALAISREFGMNQDAYRMASLRSERKLRKTGKTLEEFCGEDFPAFILAD